MKRTICIAGKNNIAVDVLDYCLKKYKDFDDKEVEFDRIIKIDKFKSDKLFNIHFSLLPEYKGMYPSVLPILHNNKCSGGDITYNQRWD